MSSTISKYSSSLNLSRVSPSITFPSVRIPISRAIDAAVFRWSPVIILTLIPAFLHAAIDLSTFSFGGSIIPTSPVNIKSFSTLSPIFSVFLYAIPKTLNALSLISFIFSVSVSFTESSRISTLPLLSMCLHLPIMISGAPLVRTKYFSPFSCIVVIILRLLSNGISSTLGNFSCKSSLK